MNRELVANGAPTEVETLDFEWGQPLNVDPNLSDPEKLVPQPDSSAPDSPAPDSPSPDSSASDSPGPDSPGVEPRDADAAALRSPEIDLTEHHSLPEASPARPSIGQSPSERAKSTWIREALRSIRSRLLPFVVVGALLGIVSTALFLSALSRAADGAATIAASSSLRSSRSFLLSELRKMDSSTDDDRSSLGREVETLNDQLLRFASSGPAASVARTEVDLTEDFFQAATEEPGVFDGSLFEKLSSAHDATDSALTAEEERQLSAINSARVFATALGCATVVLGILLLVLLWRLVSDSLMAPLRNLSRAVRRFGDGDLDARAQPGPDDVGSVAGSFNEMAETTSRQILRLTSDAQRGAQLRLITDALDLADSERDVHRIVEQALELLAPLNPSELLAIDGVSSNLTAVAQHPTAGAAGCPVALGSGCVAMRRGQTMVFEDPKTINACPMLKRHPVACSAACVPVNVNGYMLGVLHVAAEVGTPPSADMVDQLVTFGGQVGARISAIRTLDSTRLEAETDPLTGLANRRTLEARVGDLLRSRTPFVLAVADLDYFKQLNDSYGHEVGDLALKEFAKVLQANVRGHDLVARYGGEEFVLVYPEMSVQPSLEVIDRIRQALAQAIRAAGLPSFTCSFGVTHSSVGDSVAVIVRAADAALYTAKDLGRNRVIYADQALASSYFGSGNQRSR